MGGRRPIRPVEIDGDVVRVPLTKGQVAIVDLADLYIVAPYNWCADERRNGQGFYAGRSTPRDEQGRQRFVLMHRVLMGNPPLLVDHRDGDGLNNRRRNLRMATHEQNMANRRPHRTNTSGVPGVCFDKRTGKWQTQIRVGGQNIYLGQFDDINEAGAVYQAALVTHRGEFARI